MNPPYELQQVCTVNTNVSMGLEHVASVKIACTAESLVGEMIQACNTGPVYLYPWDNTQRHSYSQLSVS